MIVKLNKKQFDYLNDGLSQKEILKLKVKHESKENQFVFIEIDDDTVDKIRDWASDQLQRKGFDSNYELTPEGELLENLIDEFYM